MAYKKLENNSTFNTLKIGNISSFSKRKSVYDYSLIKFELSSACNASCQFCLMFEVSGKPRDFMKTSDTKRFLEKNYKWLIDKKIYIEPFFNGESLLNPNFFDIIDSIVNRGCLLGDLDTNLGLSIDIERLSKLPLRSITVNIGGTTKEVHERVMGTPFDTVCKNLATLCTCTSRKFPLYLKMNPVRDNIKQIDTLDDFLQQFGKSVHWKAQQTGIPVPSDLSSKQLTKSCKQLYDPTNPTSFRFTPLSTGLQTKLTKCIYMVPCINANGVVTICSHDQQRHLNLGNAFETPLSEIFTSKKYIESVVIGQNRQHRFCKECN